MFEKEAAVWLASLICCCRPYWDTRGLQRWFIFWWAVAARTQEKVVQTRLQTGSSTLRTYVVELRTEQHAVGQLRSLFYNNSRSHNEFQTPSSSSVHNVLIWSSLEDCKNHGNSQKIDICLINCVCLGCMETSEHTDSTTEDCPAKTKHQSLQEIQKNMFTFRWQHPLVAVIIRTSWLGLFTIDCI